ncbi:sugar kinase [Sediminibacter sp. Hel_I_10]|uniref:sugar kinase n=1 Tax=Sediminibacter sp. Hel_I_10 TaxID=1392490 RepID=UPI00047CD430|nr:sugar kinase [Sediminibacter sp. Hel_I_10]
MSKVVAFGELLLRLSTPGFLKIDQANSFDANYGGGEYNVAVSLANFGISTSFVTRLPDNDLGLAAKSKIRQNRVDDRHVVMGGKQLGIYFLETGTSLRSSKVIYYRRDSAIATMEPGTINWHEVFADATWFHWSGVTPAISQSAADCCLEALKVASEMNLTISADLNYRSTLWNYGKQPSEIMPQLLKYSHVILGDLDTAYFMLGRELPNPDYKDLESLKPLYDELFEAIGDLKIAAMTIRESVSASHQKIGGLLCDGSQIYKTPKQSINPVVDRVGSGDAFMAGLIYGLQTYTNDYKKTLDFATYACCLKHTISGDLNKVSVEDVETLMGGDKSGKVSR